MKMIKFNYFVLILFIATALSIASFTGCVSSKYRTPDLPEWQIAQVTSSDSDVLRIYEVDGQIATGKLKGENSKSLPDTIIVPSGQHEIVPCYINDDSEIYYGDPIRFYTRHEEIYTVKHKIKWNKTIRFWIEHNGIDITSEY